jgi:hypothetical protein
MGNSLLAAQIAFLKRLVFADRLDEEKHSADQEDYVRERTLYHQINALRVTTALAQRTDFE